MRAISKNTRPRYGGHIGGSYGGGCVSELAVCTGWTGPWGRSADRCSHRCQSLNPFFPGR